MFRLDGQVVDKKNFFFENFECLLVRTRNLLPNYFKLKSRI